MFCRFFVFLCFAVFNEVVAVNVENLPAFENLNGFWPLDEQHQLNEVVKNSTTLELGAIEVPQSGPFGGSSYSVAASGDNLAAMNISKMADQSWTIGFYFSSTNGGNPSIMCLDDVFCIEMAPPKNLVIWKKGLDGLWKNWDICLFQNSNDWNFIAISYDHIAGNLFVFGNEGKIVATSISRFRMFLPEPVPVIIGRRYDGTSTMTTNDRISCLFFYNTTLEMVDVATIPQGCQFKGSQPVTSK